MKKTLILLSALLVATVSFSSCVKEDVAPEVKDLRTSAAERARYEAKTDSVALAVARNAQAIAQIKHDAEVQEAKTLAALAKLKAVYGATSFDAAIATTNAEITTLIGALYGPVSAVAGGLVMELNSIDLAISSKEDAKKTATGSTLTTIIAEIEALQKEKAEKTTIKITKEGQLVAAQGRLTQLQKDLATAIGKPLA